LNVKLNDDQLKQLIKEIDLDGSGMYEKISNLKEKIFPFVINRSD